MNLFSTYFTKLSAAQDSAIDTALGQAETHLDGAWGTVFDTLSDVKFSIGHVDLNLFLILKGLVIVFVLQWLVSSLLRRAERRLHNLKNMRASDRTLIMKMLTIGLYFLICVVGLQSIGVDLTALSVLGGALGVGIGFGLQKIASNFISGIILLFEKSIEVDDLIEMTDGTIGFVRQTYARYTLMEAYDGREILIPNEEFITQRVITWTHTSRRVRIEVLVGVAYDSDLDLVEKLVLDAARSHPQCLSDPEPNFFVTAFGESSINLQLFFWIDNITDGKLCAKSDVMRAIVKSFREHGVSIPFPQREVRMLDEDADASTKPTPPARKPAKQAV
ncbi:MAG: mechanosensitive ion channel family protein [Rickettsiales bacterium]